MILDEKHKKIITIHGCINLVDAKDISAIISHIGWQIVDENNMHIDYVDDKLVDDLKEIAEAKKNEIFMETRNSGKNLYLIYIPSLRLLEEWK